MKIPALALVVLVASVSTARAQRPRLAGQRALSDAPGAQDNRAGLERQLRREFARVVRNRVGLSDQQMNQLVPLTQKHEQQRRQLQVEERDARLALVAMLREEKTADTARVSGLLQRLTVDVPKRRLQLMEVEQRDLATIMSPVQRAKFMAVQEQLRRRIEQMRQRRMPQFEGGTPPGSPGTQRPPR